MRYIAPSSMGGVAGRLVIDDRALVYQKREVREGEANGAYNWSAFIYRSYLLQLTLFAAVTGSVAYRNPCKGRLNVAAQPPNLPERPPGLLIARKDGRHFVC